MKKVVLLICFFSIAGLTGLYAGNGMQPDHLSKVQNVTEVAVSPSGNNIAYLLLTPVDVTEGIGFFYSELYVFDVKNSTSIPLITGKVNISSIGWVPGKEEISFRQQTESTNGHQVFSIKLDDKEIDQLTDFSRPVSSYKFRNADEIIFTSVQAPSPDKQRLLRMGIDIKVYEEELQDIELLRYNLNTGKTIVLVPNSAVYDFELSPDGSKVAIAASEKNLVDDYYMFQRIRILDIETGNVIRRMNNPGKLGKMSWSPDGKRLAFLSASKLEDAVVGSLYVMNTEGSEERFENLVNHVKGLELSVIDVIWEDAVSLLYTSEESVDITLTRLNLKNNKREQIITGGQVVFRGPEHNKGNLYFAGNTWVTPNELMHFDIRKKKLNKLSNHNDDWLINVALAKQEKVTWKARDGKSIDGVLLYPLDYQEGKSYPVIVYIHGGPEACVKNGWNNGYSQWGQFAAARGFFVFSPNYRASSGRGVDFTMAGYGDLVGTEYDDVLDGIDHLIAQGKVDRNRVGIGGGSYGGYFAAYSATRHSDRFAAAVVFVGISNQVSKRKTTDIPYEDYHVHWGFWTHENHEKVWSASPMKYITNSRTPTLILHGEDDPRIPVSQGLELYRGLKLHGKAPVRFVLYPGEGHGNRKNINRYDYLVRTLDWFEYYLIQNPGSGDMPEKYIDYPIH